LLLVNITCYHKNVNYLSKFDDGHAHTRRASQIGSDAAIIERQYSKVAENMAADKLV